jgi:hypothetical protein
VIVAPVPDTALVPEFVPPPQAATVAAIAAAMANMAMGFDRRTRLTPLVLGFCGSLHRSTHRIVLWTLFQDFGYGEIRSDRWRPA